MAQELLVDNRIEDGQKLIVELSRSGFDVVVAFWAQTSEEGLWSLYIASNSVIPSRIGDAYRALYIRLHRITVPSISLSDIKLVHPSNPIARDALALRERYWMPPLKSVAGKAAERDAQTVRARELGNVSIEEAYIYPNAETKMSSENVLRTITALMSRRGVLQPSEIAFRDGTSIQAIPVGVQMDQLGKVQAVFRDIQSHQERIVPIDEVIDIQ